MYKRSGECDMGLMFTVLVLTATSFFHVTLDYPHQVSRRVKDTDAMCEPAVCGARINEFRKSKLFNPTQTLKGPRLDHLPHHMLELVGSKFGSGYEAGLECVAVSDGDAILQAPP